MTVPALAAHRIFASRNVDEAHAFLQSKQFRMEFPRGDPTPMDAHINGIYLPGSYIGCFYYGRTMVTTTTPARTDFWVQLAARKRFRLNVGDHEVVCDAATGAVLSASHENTIHSETDCSRLVMSLTGANVVRQLTALIGGPLTTPLEFEPALGIGTGYGRSIARYIHTAATDLEEDDSLLRSPLAMNMFEQFVITGLLLSHPHNYSTQLTRTGPSISPRDVKRATDYIHANLQSEINLADIVSVAGVPGRTLFKHFREFTGASPMGYLRTIRFERVRSALLEARDDASIGAIAGSYGFEHLGRFSVEYRRRFGEKPSETLARRKRRV